MLGVEGIKVRFMEKFKFFNTKQEAEEYAKNLKKEQGSEGIPYGSCYVLHGRSLPSTVDELFKRTRSERKLTQCQMAHVCGMTRTALSNIENRVSLPSLCNLGRFIHFFQPDPELLLEILVKTTELETYQKIKAPGLTRKERQARFRASINKRSTS